MKGFKFHPSVQEFFPNDRLAYPLYEVIAEAKLPALFHTGQTGVGAGTRGGGGIRLKYSNPLHLDDVAADFPDMPIILAHPSFPWQEEALSVATHKPQVYIDLSGWSPKYFPPILVQYANTLLKDKILFGSDYPVISPEKWMEEFDKLPIKPEVRPLIMKENAARLPANSKVHARTKGNRGGLVPVKVYTGEIEPQARAQLVNISRLPIVHHHVAAMPDVHLGIGATVGSVIPTKRAIIPAAVGVDIGCGMMATRSRSPATTSMKPR